MSDSDVAPFSVVIIGGAFSGASMLVHLIERFGASIRNGRLRISMFERTQDPGTGLAWSSAMASDCQLCNLPVGVLRLSDAFRPTFQEWLVRNHGDEFGADEDLASAYPPRRYFGAYVRAMLEQLIRETSARLDTGVEVVSVEPVPAPRSSASRALRRRYRVTLQRLDDRGQLTAVTDGERSEVEADCVILCSGSPTTGGNTRFAHLAGLAGYVETPWPASELEHAVRDATGIAILGTGLTAIDVAKHLRALRPGVRLLMTSRRGRFNVVARDLRRPAVARQPSYECSVCTPERLAALPERWSLEEAVDLLKQEIEACMGGRRIDWEFLLGSRQDGVAEWRRHAAAHRAGRRSRWQLALGAIDDVFPQLWRRLGDTDRQRWSCSEMRTVFQNYSNPLPIESAEEVLSRIDSGEVVVRSGLQTVEPLEKGGFRLYYNNRDRDSDSAIPLIASASVDAARVAAAIKVSHCVNCTGVGFDVRRDPSPLMQQLLRDGLLCPHPFGGVWLDPESCKVVGADRQPQIDGATAAPAHNLYVVGHCARGVRYLTSGLGFLRAMIRGVVGDIGRAIGAGV